MGVTVEYELKEDGGFTQSDRGEGKLVQLKCCGHGN